MTDDDLIRRGDALADRAVRTAEALRNIGPMLDLRLSGATIIYDLLAQNAALRAELEAYRNSHLHADKLLLQEKARAERLEAAQRLNDQQNLIDAYEDIMDYGIVIAKREQHDRLKAAKEALK